MTTREKPKKNPDYTASAENLTNAPEVNQLLESFHECGRKIAETQAQLEAYPETQILAQLGCEQSSIRREIETAILKYGGYQDIENGHYALRQKAISVSYLLDKVKSELPPDVASRVIVESVDKGKVETLIHDRVITGTQANAISESKTVYRTIIK